MLMMIYSGDYDKKQKKGGLDYTIDIVEYSGSASVIAS
jgi:hypothetical protein